MCHHDIEIEHTAIEDDSTDESADDEFAEMPTAADD
ncbi:hypothetical protein SAMN05192554_12324 [Haloarchaeobius iranensis]|uniref:Uncharacterized protein n=1 Tax=Haloarchaeobius iranensis TaxID=996166 RepID=A0A1G9ZXC7_9EURY|nr:hypothetical protein SAMN05192554_12324 [Haloarchaeobius iranensis]